jgi:RNA polymerase primary sigma factor
MTNNKVLLAKLALCTTKEEKKKIKGELVSNNLGLVNKIAYKYSFTRLDQDDLVQEGCIGLLIAIDKYDAELDTQFGYFAGQWIAQSIRRAVENTGTEIRIPAWVHEITTKAYMINSTRMEDGKEPLSTKELADALNVEPLKLEGYLISLIHPLSLDETVATQSDLYGSQGTMKHEIIADPTSIFDLSSQDLHERIELLLSFLNDRDGKVIKDYFGLEDDKTKTLEEIGKELGITLQMVAKIKDRIIASCKKRPRNLIFKGFKE